ncbi:hypothetical protein PPUJ20066_49490 [Pseudomonas putida]|uniref:colicin E3/pyocin S6 family cytotoxin n=1 Tax=Pseudomonas sp. ITEM 17296 TaxID=2790281 RepID=UPI00235C5D72|nr:hypothetical protein PPUJ20066_49490 [Pseudomonas putida]
MRKRDGSTTDYVFEPATFIPMAQAMINASLDLLPQPRHGDHYDIDWDPARPKTPIQGGGGLRKRWKLPDGCICEWDSQHGEIEKYDRRGRHLGAFDPETGNPIPSKNAKSVRRVEP